VNIDMEMCGSVLFHTSIDVQYEVCNDVRIIYKISALNVET